MMEDRPPEHDTGPIVPVRIHWWRELRVLLVGAGVLTAAVVLEAAVLGKLWDKIQTQDAKLYKMNERVTYLEVLHDVEGSVQGNHRRGDPTGPRERRSIQRGSRRIPGEVWPVSARMGDFGAVLNPEPDGDCAPEILAARD